MFTKTARRTLLLALALILCLLPAAAQAGVLDLSSRSEARIVAARVQEGILSAAWKRLMGILRKEGASIDPNGNTGGTSGSGTNNSGASIDPTGTPNPNPSGNGG
jgi:hypothetical protein